MRKLLMALSLFSLPLLGQLRAPERLGSLALLNMPNGFAVMKDKHITPIEPDCVDSTLRKMDYKQRTQYLLKGGVVEVNQADTQEYTLKAVANVKGGGPITGWICWGAVMLPGLVVIAIVKKLDQSGLAPTDKMFDCLNSVAKVAKSCGDTAPTP